MEDRSTKRRLLIAATVARTGLGFAALPLAAGLHDRHPAALLAINPSKELLVYGGYRIHTGTLSVVTALLAALPLTFLGVWASFALGREYADDPRRERDDSRIGWFVRSSKVAGARCAIEHDGAKILVLGRLAYFPAAVTAAAAGASGLSWRRFLIADTIGGTVQLVGLLVVGNRLGELYAVAGGWLTALGVAACAGIALVLARSMRSACADPEAEPATWDEPEPALA